MNPVQTSADGGQTGNPAQFSVDSGQRENPAQFVVDVGKCVGCGRCVLVCPGGVLSLNAVRRPVIRDFPAFGWDGCWKCGHCLAVCPKGAVSILGDRPEDSLPPVQPETAAPTLDALIVNRHSCRRYQDRDVEPEVLLPMLDLLANAPNGGNKQQVEFTLIDDRARMERFRRTARAEMERLAARDVFPAGYDRPSYEQLKGWERTVRPDMLFCGAPNLLIPHAPLGRGEPRQDVLTACAYFELLCASRGLGCVMMTFPLDVLNLMPEVKALLEIPEDHFIGLFLGFGYPQIPYARGTQRKIEPGRIHRPQMKELEAL